MDAQERADFYQEISNRGILIFLSEDTEEGRHCVSKLPTQTDPRVGLTADIQFIFLANRDQAESYVKSFIEWDWKPKQEEPILQIAPNPEITRFSSYMMFDIGFGPENLDLGEIEASDPALVQSIAESRAKDHFDKYLPKENFEQTKKAIRIRPVS